MQSGLTLKANGINAAQNIESWWRSKAASTSALRATQQLFHAVESSPQNTAEQPIQTVSPSTTAMVSMQHSASAATTALHSLAVTHNKCSNQVKKKWLHFPLSALPAARLRQGESWLPKKAGQSILPIVGARIRSKVVKQQRKVLI